MKDFETARVVSIIVTYNGEKWIEKCLSSLQIPNLKNIIIVIDNGSTDKTIEIIQNSFSNVILKQIKSNLGFGKANNIGFEEAKKLAPDFILLLNQDAWLKEKTLEKLINIQLKNPEYGILSPIHLAGDGNVDVNFQKYMNVHHCPGLISDLALNRQLKIIYETTFVNAAIWLIPIKTIDEIGVFLPIFNHYGEDDNFVHRCRYHNLKIGIVPEIFGLHDRSQSNTGPENFTSIKFKNFVYSHYLAILLNPNNTLKKKKELFFQTFIKNFYRKPWPTIAATLKIFFNLIKVRQQYEISKLKKVY